MPNQVNARHLLEAAAVPFFERPFVRQSAQLHLQRALPRRGGRRKRCYELEASGILALRSSCEEYAKMAEGMGLEISEAVAGIEREAGR